MLGSIFVAFAEFVEDRWGLETYDMLFSRPDLVSGGAYTTVGSYPDEEIMLLFAALAEHTGEPPTELLRSFGRALFGSLHAAHGGLAGDYPRAQDLLMAIGSSIHREVDKLYSGARTPTIVVHEVDGARLDLVYRSERNLPDLCHGLIEGCFNFFGQTVKIERADETHDGAPATRFQLTCDP